MSRSSRRLIRMCTDKRFKDAFLNLEPIRLIRIDLWLNSYLNVN